MARREQRLQRRAQAFGPVGQRAGDHPRGVLRLRLADDEAGVAQGDDEAGEAPCASPGPDRGLRPRKHAAPITRVPHATWPTSRLVVSGLIARAVLARLEERDQRLMDDLRLLPQILDAEPGEGRRPVERLGDAGNLLQVLLAQQSRPCARSARRGWRRCRAGGRGESPPRDRRRENRDSDRGSGGAARRRARAWRWRSAPRAGW